MEKVKTTEEMAESAKACSNAIVSLITPLFNKDSGFGILDIVSGLTITIVAIMDQITIPDKQENKGTVIKRRIAGLVSATLKDFDIND